MFAVSKENTDPMLFARPIISILLATTLACGASDAHAMGEHGTRELLFGSIPSLDFSEEGNAGSNDLCNGDVYLGSGVNLILLYATCTNIGGNFVVRPLTHAQLRSHGPGLTRSLRLVLTSLLHHSLGAA